MKSLKVTPKTHFRIDLGWGGDGVFFPKFELNENQLQTLGQVIKMVLSVLVCEPDEKEQNPFRSLGDYLADEVMPYLTKHAAYQDCGACRPLNDNPSDGVMLLAGDVLLSLPARILDLFRGDGWYNTEARRRILKAISDIARTGDVSYLKPLIRGSITEDAVESCWEPMTIDVSYWWDSEDLLLSGRAATTLERMGFDLTKHRGRLLVPVYFHKEVSVPTHPETGRYGAHGYYAAVIYLTDWLSSQKYGRNDSKMVRAGSCRQDLVPVHFPQPEQCLFVTKEGGVSLGPPTTENCKGAMEVEGFAIRLGDQWLAASDLLSDNPGSGFYTQQQPRVFHRLTLEEIYQRSPWWVGEHPKLIQKAIYRPGTGVELLGEPMNFYQFIPCPSCEKRRKTAHGCSECKKIFCEHCVCLGKFCSAKCAVEVSSRQERNEELSRYLKV